MGDLLVGYQSTSQRRWAGGPVARTPAERDSATGEPSLESPTSGALTSAAGSPIWGGLRVRIDQLVALGPIASTKFTDLRLDDLDVNMERWTFANLDILELSIRVKPKDDESADVFQSCAKLSAACSKPECRCANEA